jgi:hypothetical protein
MTHAMPGAVGVPLVLLVIMLLSEAMLLLAQEACASGKRVALPQWRLHLASFMPEIIRMLLVSTPSSIRRAQA